MFLSMILGVFGLLILIMIHELGHFIFAKIAGIKVEVFSLGFGPKIWKKTIRGVEYALSVFPLGGYCKMSGETLIDGQTPNPGDMYYGSVWRRTLAVLGGPLFSFLGGWMFFVFAAPLPHMVDFTPPKIVVQKDHFPAPLEKFDPAIYGFSDADIITSINGTPIERFDQIFSTIALSARRELTFDLLRGTQKQEIKATPLLLPDGRGFLPIFPWYEPIISSVIKDSPAEKAGLLAGDLVISVAGETIKNTAQLSSLIQESEGALNLEVQRDGKLINLVVTPTLHAEMQRKTMGVFLGKSQVGLVEGSHGWNILMNGTSEFTRSMRLYVWGLSNLFHGMNPLRALSGPVQNTYLIGEVAKSTIATDSEGQKTWSLYNIFTLLGFISVALGIMNLLPIPLLDGGLLVLYLIEGVRGKYLTQAGMRVYQYIGLAFILLLLSLALLSDMFFILKK